MDIITYGTLLMGQLENHTKFPKVCCRKNRKQHDFRNRVVYISNFDEKRNFDKLIQTKQCFIGTKDFFTTRPKCSMNGCHRKKL